MAENGLHTKPTWTPEQRAEHRAIRERFHRERPTLEQLVASGEYTVPLPHGVYLNLCLIARDLRQTREAADLSLADLAERCGFGATEQELADIERQVFEPAGVALLLRYANALGKRVALTLEDQPAPAVAG